MSQNSTNIKIHYSGDIDQIDANLLVASLLHTTTIIQETNREFNTGRKIQTNIKALEKGSFDIFLVLSDEGVLSSIQNIFTKSNITYLANIVVVMTGVYQTFKFLKGRKPKKIKVLDDGKREIHNYYGETTIVNQNTYNIFQNDKVKNGINREFKLLEKDRNITEYKIINNNDEEKFSLRSDEFHYFSNIDKNEDETRYKEVNKAHLGIIGILFDKNKWEFIYDGNKIRATICDKAYLQKIDDKEVSFSKGDKIIADLEILQVSEQETKLFINKEFKIIKVHEHIKVERQRTLFDNK